MSDFLFAKSPSVSLLIKPIYAEKNHHGDARNGHSQCRDGTKPLYADRTAIRQQRTAPALYKLCATQRRRQLFCMRHHERPRRCVLTRQHQARTLPIEGKRNRIRYPLADHRNGQRYQPRNHRSGKQCHNTKRNQSHRLTTALLRQR